MSFWDLRLLRVPYKPRPQERPFLQREVVQKDDEVAVHLAVLDDRESERYFGVPLARRGIQPVWLRIANQSGHLYRLRLATLDPNYYPPLEAAFASHFRIGKRLVAFGVLAWLFFPLLILLPFKILGARAANRRMNAFFQDQGIGSSLIRPAQEIVGFVFTSLDEGTKQITVRLQSTAGVKDFAFAVVVPGLRVDHGGKPWDEICESMPAVECDDEQLRQRLTALPRTTTNRSGTREGDPLNLVVIGDFDTVMNGFGARWDETEVIGLRSCWRTFKAFALASRYRYSPVSALYVNQRCQDFALQRTRETLNERLHLRLWLTPLRFKGKPVWVGQISRDIGVRFTLKTWNLTTHQIDSNVDEARDYVLDDLMEAGRVSVVGYVPGVEAAARTAPRANLTGDSYFTDGLRAVALFSETRTNPKFLGWT